jgi:MHS family alpha-ketoglutarate permease-like MFS transporter
MNAIAPIPGTRTARPQSKWRAIAGASTGNLVEWFDWYTYSAMSLYFAASFFPSSDPTAQLLNSAAIFAVGFLMRPIGGWLMGVYADRHGRKAALSTSVLMMCSGSLLIALTPPATQIGLAAPVLLTLARLLQGLSVGGEYGASATYLSEIAPPDRRGFFTSFQYVTLIMGQLLSLGVLLVLQLSLSNAQLETWGWRIPFVIGAFAAVIVFWLRRNLEEPETFEKAHERRESRASLRLLFAHPRQVAVVVGLTLGGTVAFYTYTTYAQKFLVNTVELSKQQATIIVSCALFVFMCLQPMFGWLSDRIGRRALLLGFGISGTLLTVPCMTALAQTRDPLTAFALIMVLLVVVSGYTSINAAVKAELFPVEIRALGVAFPYAVTVSVFGGTAEYVALLLKQAGHEALFFWYVSLCILISLIVYGSMPDTSKREL